MHTQSFTVELGGKKLTAEINDMAHQSNGSVLMKYGETAVLITAVMSEQAESNVSYFPLSIEFEEKFYAAGKILGSRYTRREGKPSDQAVLAARLIDRTVRPLFKQSLRHSVQIVVSVLAIGEDDPDIVGVIGASLALGISDIPWDGPVGCVRISRNKNTGLLSINPTYENRPEGLVDFEVVTCGKNNTINMIEVAATEIAEADMLELFAATTIFHNKLVDFQKMIIKSVGKTKKIITEAPTKTEVINLFESSFRDELQKSIFSNKAGKSHITVVKDRFKQAVIDLNDGSSVIEASDFFEEKVNEIIHHGALQLGLRADGRDFNTVRPIYAQAGGISPILHGSGIFYRGDTHVLSALTLGSPAEAQQIESIEGIPVQKRFMHHYNFPPYAVGETGRVGGFNRRMIGHGALAEKALAPLLPTLEEFPYTIRLVSETLASNGSSSMGAVCAGTLALFDGGVKLKRPVAGIASGVMADGDSFVILTDIQGPEDEHGDMDFKVAGTREGITAIQMDVKISGVSLDILKEALHSAKLARLGILEKMTEAIATPRTYISDRAPHIITLNILPEQIGLIIGSGGKTINKIKDDSGVEEINIEDDGKIYISGKESPVKKASEIITAMTKQYTVGDKLDVTITKITAFGAFARLDTFHEGLIHISEVTTSRLETLEGILQVGQTVPVAVVKIDEGKIGLSIKKIDENFLK